ncbi:MAG: thioredoxin domain-containing protein [Novosphingobium sp.]|nr:thioredoxin domain-containing protein [Novosphingobium sp.]
MKFGIILKAAALAGIALLVSAQTNRNWPTVVTQTADGAHRIGNPDAKVKLVEYVSYTCPHCAEFTREADDRIKLAYVTPGNVNLEVRHLIRDPIDLTVVMLANCGPVSKFALNHSTFMLQQSKWIGPLASPTAAQRTRWTSGDGPSRRRAIASDFGLYKIMEGRGYRRADVDRCLSDEAAARRFAEQSQKDWDRPGIDGTPSFSINGVVMPGTHTWSALEQQLNDFL